MSEAKKGLEGKVNRKTLKKHIMAGMTVCIPRRAVESSPAMQWNVSPVCNGACPLHIAFFKIFTIHEKYAINDAK